MESDLQEPDMALSRRDMLKATIVGCGIGSLLSGTLPRALLADELTTPAESSSLLNDVLNTNPEFLKLRGQILEDITRLDSRYYKVRESAHESLLENIRLLQEIIYPIPAELSEALCARIIGTKTPRTDLSLEQRFRLDEIDEQFAKEDEELTTSSRQSILPPTPEITCIELIDLIGDHLGVFITIEDEALRQQLADSTITLQKEEDRSYAAILARICEESCCTFASPESPYQLQLKPLSSDIPEKHALLDRAFGVLTGHQTERCTFHLIPDPMSVPLTAQSGDAYMNTSNEKIALACPWQHHGRRYEIFKSHADCWKNKTKDERLSMEFIMASKPFQTTLPVKDSMVQSGHFKLGVSCELDSKRITLTTNRDWYCEVWGDENQNLEVFVRALHLSRFSVFDAGGNRLDADVKFKIDEYATLPEIEIELLSPIKPTWIQIQGYEKIQEERFVARFSDGGTQERDVMSNLFPSSF